MTEHELLRANGCIKAFKPESDPIDPQNVITADTRKAFEIAGQEDPRPDIAATRARLAANGVNRISKRWGCDLLDACLLLAIWLKTPLEEVARYMDFGEPESFMRPWCRAVEHLEKHYPKGWEADEDDDISDTDDE